MPPHVPLSVVLLLVCWLSVGAGTVPACAEVGASTSPIAPEVSALYTLVRNGDFEEGGDLPAWWAPFPPQPEVWGSHRLDREVFHAGKASGALISNAVHPAGKATVQWMKYTVPVEGGSSLIFHYWIRIDRTRPIGAGCHFYRADKGHVGFVPVPVPSLAREWTYVRQIVPVPPEAVSMGIALYGGDEGTTWYDDVGVLGTPSMTASQGTPTVDGDLRDRCWGENNSVTLPVVEPGTRLANPRPRGWVAYDNEAVYVAFRCPDGGQRSVIQGLAPSGKTVAGDYVEVLLDPRHQHREVFRVQLNAAGTLLAARGNGEPWEAHARGAARVAGNGWSVELAIPLASLGIDLDVGKTWGLNLAVHYASRGEDVTWSLGAQENAGRLGNVTLTPDLTEYYRPGLEQRLQKFARSHARLEAQIRQVAMPASSRTRADRLLGQAAEAAEELRTTTAALDRERILSRLAGLEDLLNQARRVALDGAYSVEPTVGQADFRVVIASALEKVPQTEAVRGEIPLPRVKLTAAGDETESFQLVVIPGGADVVNLKVEAPPLRGPGGEVPVKWYRVGYVETAQPDYAADFVGWWPDPLLPAGPVDVAVGHRQPLWFSVQVPPNAAPGMYAGVVTVRSATHVVSVPVQLRVRAFTLPRPGTLATAFGLYASSLSKWWWDKAPYRDHMPIEMFREWCEFLGEYRLGVKNIGAEYITETEENGELKVDLSNLQRTVAPLAGKYFAPWSMSVYRVPSSVTLAKISPVTGPAEHARTVAAYVKEWEREGLPREVHIYGYDEPNPGNYPFLIDAYRRIREAAPGYPIMQTLGDPNPRALAGLVDIWCPLTPALTSDFYRERLAAGDRLWGYTCCSPKPPYANFFIDEPALDHRILFWQLRQAGATGFLYWCVCYWDGLPNAASGKPCFPDVPIHLRDLATYKSYKDNGDGFLVYPGRERKPWPSIRLETIRDGIEDYEYLGLLQRLVDSTGRLPTRQRPPQEMLARAQELCRVPTSISNSMTQYTKTPALVLERREQVGDMIEELLSRGVK